jgi:hypothetical protein
MNKKSIRIFIAFDLREIAACNTPSHSTNNRTNR